MKEKLEKLFQEYKYICVLLSMENFDFYLKLVFDCRTGIHDDPYVLRV